MKRSPVPSGMSLVELLVYLAILGMLSLGIAAAIQYFQENTKKINQETQLSLDGQSLNAVLRTKLTGASSLQPVAGYASVNGNYCYQISENKPESFASADIANGANFQYRVVASSTPTLQNQEPKLSSSASLGLSSTTAASSIQRTLSIWVRLPNDSGNDRVLFDYSPEAANSTSYKLVVRVAGGNSVRVDMGLGLAEFVYDVSNIRNGEWHHLVVVADRLTTNNLQAANTSPVLYVDGRRVNASANSGTAALSYVNNLNYKINIGDYASAPWGLGPVGLWNRVLSTEEIGKLGRMSNVNVTDAFWLLSPTASISTSASSVMNGQTVNARTQIAYLLFKKVRSETGQTFFNIYHIDQAQSCPDPSANDDATPQGFTKLSSNMCVAATGDSPILIGAGAAGQELGFQWRCKLTDGQQVSEATVVTGNTTTSIKKSSEACGLPIAQEDFATNESANTAFIIIDNFDANVDLMTFEGNSFPAQMVATTSVSGDSVAGAPAGTSVTWFADAANNVGMMKVVTAPLTSQTKSWWVNSVFKKIKYKARSDTYAAERKLVFALGDAWPIKVCPSLGYKAGYHFYRVQTSSSALTTQQAYRDAYQNRRYFGMTGYLGNMRCPNEKDQVSSRVLSAGNNVATIGAWATRQSATAVNSSPNFFTGRESVLNGATVNDTWGGTLFVNPSGLSDVDGGTDNTGAIQWRWIGGPAVDHNVIMLTDHTLCNGATIRSENSKKGCSGMNTITVDHACDTVTNAASPACRLQNQSGGNRQYGWWQPAEPNESGAHVWMGYTGSNYWDDSGSGSAKTAYLLEFGDHPWDVVTAPTSPYKAALGRANDTSANLDPPNVATKSVRTVNSQYCQ